MIIRGGDGGIFLLVTNRSNQGDQKCLNTLTQLLSSPALLAASVPPSPSAWPLMASPWSSTTLEAPHRLKSSPSKIQAKGGKAITAQADVSDPAAVARMFESTELAFGRIDVLVNNAGILKTIALADTSDEEFDRHFLINTKNTFNTLREAAKRMKDGGRIINFSSTTLALNMPGYAVYNGTKAAVEAFTRVFAKELRGRNITVNAVAPGPIATDLFLNGKSEELIAQFSKMPRWSVSDSQPISPASSPSSPALMQAGSTARSSALTAASHKTSRKLATKFTTIL
jgi:NAD(P)-dependent dehydrogenase (short-subunit alcohol dehydrogenase family)